AFTFQINDDVSTARCQLDSAPDAVCTSPTSQTYSSLPLGAHTFTVQAIDAAGNTATATYSWTITTQPPVNTALPTISGQATVGQTLTAAKGTWTGTPTPTYTYQWKRCDTGGANCAAISGATHTTYTVATADAGSTLLVTVTAKNSVGSASANSAATAVVTSAASAPVNTAVPVVTGQAVVGNVLQASTGTWTGNPTPTYTYQWQRCDTTGNNCATITAATSASYTIAAADAGATLRATVTGTNTAGSASASSAATAVVASAASAPVNTTVPVVTGQAVVGSVLQASTGTWTGNPTPTYTYQWKRCDTTGNNCTPITGATQPSYTL